MKKHINNSKHLTVLLLWIFSGFYLLNAQEPFRLNNGSSFVVAGTSTLHNWDMKSSEAKGKAVFEINDNVLKSIDQLTVLLPTKSLKSGNSRMEKLAYSTLEANEHENILFELVKVKEINSQTIIAEGKLTIAGITRPVTLQTDYTVENNNIIFKGNHQIKFSDFNIASPTALLGAIKTGDELEISYDVSMTAEGLYSSN